MTHKPTGQKAKINKYIDAEVDALFQDADSGFLSFSDLNYNGSHTHKGVVCDAESKAHEKWLEIVEKSCYYSIFDPTCRQISSLYTDMPLGNGFTVQSASTDESVKQQADAILKQFMAEPSNHMNSAGQRRSSRRLSAKGNWFQVLQNKGTDDPKKTKQTRLRQIEPCEVRHIITNPGDPDEIWFYARETERVIDGKKKTIVRWYRDISIKDVNAVSVPDENQPDKTVHEFTDLQVVKVNKETGEAEFDEQNQPITHPFRSPVGVILENACVNHIYINTLDKRGWPILTAVLVWAAQYRKFLENRISLQRARTLHAWKEKLQGGQGVLNARKASIKSGVSTTNFQDSNPPGASASVLLENEGINRTPIDQKTAAADAKIDSDMLVEQGGLGAGIFSQWLGKEAHRLSTTKVIETPMMKAFQAMQKTLEDAYTTVLQFVLVNAGIPEEEAGVDLDFPPIVNKSRVESSNMLVQFLDKMPWFVESEEIQAFWLTLIDVNKPELVVANAATKRKEMELQADKEEAKEQEAKTKALEVEKDPVKMADAAQGAKIKFNEGLKEYAQFLEEQDHIGDATDMI